MGGGSAVRFRCRRIFVMISPCVMAAMIRSDPCWQNGQRAMAYDVAPYVYANSWSADLYKGLKVLKKVPPDRRLTLRFEDFLIAPEQSLKKRSCPCSLRINIPGSPVDCHSNKKT